MDPLASLTHLAAWLAAAAAGFAVLELALWWWLFRFRSPWYWPVCVAGSALTAWSVSLALAPAGEGGGSSLTAGMVTAVVLLTLTILARWLVKGAHAIAIMMIAPAFLAVALLVIYPFFFEGWLAFVNLNMYTYPKWQAGGDLRWVGFDNFISVFTSSPLQTATFWELLGRTVLWTAINLIFHVGIGLGLALLLNRKIKGRGIYRTLLILPWAIPQVVAVLAWRGEFHPQFGVVNQILRAFGGAGLSWWSDPWPVFASCCIVNIWLGIPFMMIVFLGGLQSIPNSYYEAASIDGASRWTQFLQITLPMLKPVVVPSVTLGTIWTFNNINVIYLMTGQDGGNEYADILISALYKAAFVYNRYSFSAAFALVIFLMLVAFTIFWMRVSKGTESPV